MVRLVVVILVLLLASARVDAVATTPADRHAIAAVVQGQLEAFQRDDGVAAFGFASPMIQDMFRTPEGFMTMVRRGYAAVYRPQFVEFVDVITYRGRLAQRVYLVDPDGQPVMAHYLMEQQADGRWRIDGVILEPLPDVGA